VACIKLSLFFFITLFLLAPFLLGKFTNKYLFRTRLAVFIKIFWSQIGLWICRVKIEVRGVNNCGVNAYVSNHVSWLDILTLQSILDLTFIAKSEVRSWPGFGFLAMIANTIFVDRRVMAAKGPQANLYQALKRGEKLCFFPEGTSTDGSFVLPFKPSLFEAFFIFDATQDLDTLIQPISLIYSHSDPIRPNIFGWWGEMALVPHIFHVLLNGCPGKVLLIFHEALIVSENTNRKKLAKSAEILIRGSFD